MAPERELPLLHDSDSESDDDLPSLVDDDSEYEFCDEPVVRERVPPLVAPFEVFIFFFSLFSYCTSASLFVL